MVPFEALTRSGRRRRCFALAKAALAEYDLRDPALEFHCANTNLHYRVTVRGRERFILRLGHPSWRTLEDLRSEAMWLGALARDTDVGAPEVVPTRDGRPVQALRAPGMPEARHFTLMTWVPGRLLGRHLSERNLGSMGALFATLHLHGKAWIPPAGFTGRRFEHWLSRGEPDVLLREAALGQLRPADRERILRMHRHVEQAYARVDRSDLRVIHCDLWHDNIKLHQGGVHPFDFEDTVNGFRSHDIAMAMLDLLEATDEETYARLLGAFRHGYEALLPWPEDPIEPFQMGRLLWKLNWVARFRADRFARAAERHAEVFVAYERTGKVRKPPVGGAVPGRAAVRKGGGASMAYPGVLEDVRRAVRRERPRRLPVFACSEEFDVKWHGRWEYETVCRDGAKIAEVWEAAIREFDYDWAWVQVDDCFEMEPLGVACRGEGNILRATVGPVPATRESLGRLRAPDPRTAGRMPEKLKAIRLLRERFGDALLIEGSCAAPFSACGLLYGLEEAMVLAMTDPGLLADTCAFFVEAQAAWIRAQVEAGADAVWLGDCNAFSSMLSVEQYRRFALPACRELVRRAHGCGALVHLHDSEISVPHLLASTETGADIVNCGPAADIAAVRRALDGKACFTGNLDPIAVLLRGAPEDVARETARIVAVGASGGGYMFNTGEMNPRDVPAENMRAMVEAARRAGASALGG